MNIKPMNSFFDYKQFGLKMYPLGTKRVQAVQAVRFETAKRYLESIGKPEPIVKQNRELVDNNA